MDSNNFETVFIREEISKCEDIDELREKIFPMIKTQQEQWAHKINDMIDESGYTKSKFADISGVSRVAVNKWCNGSIPKNRETFLRIGMAAGYGRERMDQLLQRYGQYPALYAKSLEDCVCIFVLDKEYGKETLTKYNYILDKIKDNIIRSDEQIRDMSTALFDEKLSNIKNENELEMFITDNTAIFSTTYHKFYAYVKMHIMANYQDYGGSVFELAEGQGWSSSLRQCVSAIRQGKWYPTRNKIISLGLHLNMDHDQIDEMLELAHMEPLCAKNVFESVIMFILDDASLKNILDTESGVCLNKVPDYVVGTEVTTIDDITEKYVSFKIPAGKYIKASFNAEDHETLVTTGLMTMMKAYKEWAKANKVKIDSDFTVEVYPDNLHQMEYPSMSLLVPVK